MTSGRKVIFIIAAGLTVIVIFAIVLAVYAGAPPVDPEDPTPAVRKDCPSGWKPLYDVNSRFSVCRPTDWTPQAIGNTTISMTAPAASGAGVTITWQPGTDLKSTCVPPSFPSNTTGTKSTMKIGGSDRDVCEIALPTSTGASTLDYHLPVTSGGVLDVVGTYKDTASRSLILQVLDTLKAN